ncbi:MAG: electron transport complex subunit RsxC [Gammaproteobacteria bacterium]|nr:electron transport complex subunit RsxC [Gammaproteobacteria bacterium]
MMRKLFKFPGGLHPPQHKEESTKQSLRAAILPKRLVLPLHQHIGEAAKPIVTIGERVLKGQMIAKADGYVSAPVHAPTSGIIHAIDIFPIPHPSGLSAPCIVIDSDGLDEWCQRVPQAEYQYTPPSHLRNLIRNAGIVGLGGAGFPTFIKLNPTPGKVIDTLIINGVECEPYITCDDMLMRERADEIISGAQIMRHALHADHVIIAIEDNKPQALEAMKIATRGTDIEVIAVPTKYPQGGEKQLIWVLTGKECPSDGLPFQIGIVVHNVATAAAVHRAINLGEPLISRIVTVTGSATQQPANLEVLLGTPVNELIEQCGWKDNPDRIIVGGPMMGFALHTPSVPVVKTTNCVIAAAQKDVSPPSPVMPCIRCGECAAACPVSLLPQQMYWHARAKEFDKIQDYKLFDCIECGCCAYVCPSNIPLVHYYRFAKTEIWAQEREKEKANLARQRHEARLARIEREKQEREARAAQKKAAAAEGKASAIAAERQAEVQAAIERAKSRRDQQRGKAEQMWQQGGRYNNEKEKQAEIQAALNRAKEKKELQFTAPKNIENLTPAQLQQIEEAEARRRRLAQATPPPTNNE